MVNDGGSCNVPPGNGSRIAQNRRATSNNDLPFTIDLVTGRGSCVYGFSVRRAMLPDAPKIVYKRGNAVAHTLIVIGYHLQKNQSNYDDLGGNYFDRIHSDGLKRYLVKRLQQLGHKVTLEPIEAA